MKTTINVKHIDTGTWVLGDNDEFVCLHKDLSVWYDKACDEMHVECPAQDCSGVSDSEYHAELNRQAENDDTEWLDAEYWRGIGE